tara:strand:- start:46264 stop:47577 length:1314 start_codon:yes stop_codon:yes gene_type:complete
MTREHEDLNKKMFLRFIRIGFVALMLIVVLLYVLSINRNADELEIGFAQNWWIPVLIALTMSFLFLGIDMFTPQKKISLISGVVFGLMAGLMTAWVFSTVIDLIVQTWDLQASAFGAFTTAIKVLMGVSLSYLGITMVLQTQDEFRLVIPYVEFAKEMRGPMPMVLDTSALIDARIADIAASGLIQQTIVIPEFVLEELQLLADSRDRMKRNKGRRGLDITHKLQKMSGVDVVLDNSPTQKKGVDLALVELCGRMPAMLVSLDIALVRIATIQKIRVLNVNDLANALKPVVIPGKMITVELIKPGEQHGQAVGYLEDGTMVVAEDGYPYIGQVKELVITSSMQTAAGRLLFARVDMAEMDSGDREQAIQEHRAPDKSEEDYNRDYDGEYSEDNDGEHDQENDDSGFHPVKPASINGPRVVNRPGSGGMKGTPRNPRR